MNRVERRKAHDRKHNGRLGAAGANAHCLILALFAALAMGIFALPAQAQVAAPVPPPPAAAPATPDVSPQPPAPLQGSTASPNLQAHKPAGAASAEASGAAYSSEYAPFVQKTASALMSENFTFYPIKALDPFVPFITPETPGRSDEEPNPTTRPLTPLQKMTLSEIERGLRAITWGSLGRKAVIEDSTGKGYIVSVGTPAGDRSGVITQILNDRLVIQQEIWDRKARKRYPQDFTIKLSKKTEK